MVENQSEMYLNRVLEIYEKILPTIQSIHEDISSLEKGTLQSRESYLSAYALLKEKIEDIYRETTSFPISEIKEILEYVKVHNRETFMEFTQSFKENKEDLQRIIKIIEGISILSNLDKGITGLATALEEHNKKESWIERRFKFFAMVVSLLVVVSPFLFALAKKFFNL